MMTRNDISRDERKEMVRDILQELLWEMEQSQPDPDAGLELRPEIQQRLREGRKRELVTKSVDEVMREFALR